MQLTLLPALPPPVDMHCKGCRCPSHAECRAPAPHLIARVCLVQEVQRGEALRWLGGSLVVGRQGIQGLLHRALQVGAALGEHRARRLPGGRAGRGREHCWRGRHSFQSVACRGRPQAAPAGPLRCSASQVLRSLHCTVTGVAVGAWDFCKARLHCLLRLGLLEVPEALCKRSALPSCGQLLPGRWQGKSGVLRQAAGTSSLCGALSVMHCDRQGA